jgi:hypothetical protein
MKYEGKALLILHSAVNGRLEIPIRWFQVGEIRPYAQHEVSVSVLFMKPRKRTAASVTMVPENIQYLTVEADGQVFYDSRQDVPCDMTKWEETWARFKDNPPISTRRE